MYTVERTKDKAIVHGPDGYKEIISNSAIGFVLRQDVADLVDEGAVRYAIACRDMTDAEIVGLALEHYAYPTC